MISKEEVQHIAGLARIGLSDKEMEKYVKDISSILDWMAQLDEVDVSGVEPTAHITGLENETRADKSSDFENIAGIIDLFPDKKDNYDKVRSIL